MKTITTIALLSLKELIRKKDFYVFLFLLIGIMCFFFSNMFFGVTDVSRYLKDIGFTLILLFSILLCISFNAKQIPQEITSKTIYPLLAKPVSRTNFILGKFFAGCFVSIVSFSSFFIFYMLMILLKGEGASVVLILQSYILTILLLMLLSAFSLFFSLFLTTAANITISLLLYFFISYYNSMLRDMLISVKGAMYYLYSSLFYLLPHFEFFDTKIRLVHAWEPISSWAFYSIIGYAFTYTALVLVLTTTLFRKRSL